MKVLRGMAIGRVVATADVATLRAYPQMDPLLATLEAVLTAESAWLHVTYMFPSQVGVYTLVLHHTRSSCSAHALRSSALRSHCARSAPATYVACRKSSSSCRGCATVRRLSYGKRN